jgi:hypothetical protein
LEIWHCWRQNRSRIPFCIAGPFEISQCCKIFSKWYEDKKKSNAFAFTFRHRLCKLLLLSSGELLASAGDGESQYMLQMMTLMCF